MLAAAAIVLAAALGVGAALGKTASSVAAVAPTTALPQLPPLSAPPPGPPTAVPVPVVAPPGPTTTAMPMVSLALPGAATTAVPQATVPRPPETTAAPVAGAVFASIDDLVARWNAEAQTVPVMPGVDLRISADDMAIVIGSGPGRTDAFAMEVGDGPLLGGLVDPDTGAVVQLLLLVAPGARTSTEVIVTAVDVVAPDGFVEFMTGYTDLLVAPAGTYRYVRSAATDVVLDVIPGFGGGAPSIAVAVAPLSDETTARGNVDPLVDAVLLAFTLLAEG